MDSIHENNTWELVELPTGRKLMPYKWVFRYKYVSESEKPKYKARLVSKGFKQEHGIDYDEIFSLVVKMATLRLLLGVVVTYDIELDQLDIKTAFPHRDLEEDIYMSQPAGFTVTREEGHLVCQLKKSLYGCGTRSSTPTSNNLATTGLTLTHAYILCNWSTSPRSI